MDIEKIKTILDILREEVNLPKEQQVFEAFSEPLLAEHLFVTEGEHLYLRRDQTYFADIKQSHVLPATPAHTAQYLALLEDKCRRHCALVASNKAVCRSYGTPDFDPEQAIEFARDAFFDAFKHTRHSYTQ